MRLVVVSLMCSVALLPQSGEAQILGPTPAPIPGAELDLTLNEEEITAWQLHQNERYVEARESAERVLLANKKSVIGHAVLGMIQRYGEGNLPRSLYHLRQARQLLEEAHGAIPVGAVAREWHNRIIQETAFTAAEMERYEEELELWALHDRLYDPDLPGERIWPLIQLRRFNDARTWAAKALSTGNRWPRQQAMNGLCALENEAGNRAASYRWCVSHAREVMDGSFYGGVYLSNAGESARGMLRLDEAERYYLEATRRAVEWYANPWLDVAQLYLRAGRLAPAAQAVKSMHQYVRRRPPHTQQQDQGERHRMVASLLIIAGRPKQALTHTELALRFPDRRGGQSRSPEADLATNALLHRRALLDSAERELEVGSTQGFWTRLAAQFRASWQRVRAFRASRRAVALLSDDELLRGLLEAEGRHSFATPPWLVVDLVEVVGAGPVEAALEVARRAAPPEVPALGAYFDAYGAEAAASRGDWERATMLANRAIEGLPAGEALLKARSQLVITRALEASGEDREAVTLQLELLQIDPTVFRRAGLRIPLQVVAARDQLSQRTADLLRRSPRIRNDADAPLSLQIQSEGGSTCHICFVIGGNEVGCSTETVDDSSNLESAARQCADMFHNSLLAPQVDMSLFDGSSLDGGTTSGSLDSLLGPSVTP